MVIESGIIIFIGLLFIFVKFPKHWVLVGLGYALYVDLGAALLAYVLHWGTFTGTMAAAVAGLMTSAMTTIARRFIGYTYYDRKTGEWFYKRGMRNLYPD
jgi:hypothetical protein